jgi:hypothetical protein
VAVRNVISTLSQDGTEVMGPGVLMYHYPGNDIMNGSLLAVESNHFCVLKSRGAILNVYETGQYPAESPQRPLIGSVQQAFYGGQSPWQYEALFIARAKSVAKAQGMALSGELAELDYDVDYYVHVETKEDAVKLVTHIALFRAPAHHGRGEHLRGPRGGAGHQPACPGDPAGAGQREDPRDH